MKISRSGKIDDVGKKGDNWGNDFLWIEWRYVERNSEKKVGITRITAPIYSTSRVVKTVDKHTGLFIHPQI